MIRELQKDKSWRVRYMVANHFCELCDTVSKDMMESEMTPALVRFLKDTEAEVRTAAALKVSSFSSKVSVQVVMTHIMPCIRQLTNDRFCFSPPTSLCLALSCLSSLTFVFSLSLLRARTVHGRRDGRQCRHE